MASKIKKHLRRQLFQILDLYRAKNSIMSVKLKHLKMTGLCSPEPGCETQSENHRTKGIIYLQIAILSPIPDITTPLSFCFLICCSRQCLPYKYVHIFRNNSIRI